MGSDPLRQDKALDLLALNCKEIPVESDTSRPDLAKGGEST